MLDGLASYLPRCRHEVVGAPSASAPGAAPLPLRRGHHLHRHPSEPSGRQSARILRDGYAPRGQGEKAASGPLRGAAGYGGVKGP